MQTRTTIFLLLACLLGGCGVPATPVPAIVEGDSMAPTVCGAHLLVSCDECGHDFRTEFLAKPDSGLICPNCGYNELKAGDAAVVESPEVSLQPFSKFPRRWDVVGFNLPEESKKKTGIKRIVGLPGETIEIRNGDLFSSDNILRKPWKLQKEVRIPVFDSQCNAISPFDNANRLKAAEDSSWEVRGKEIRFASDGVSKPDWIDYVHWRNCKRIGNRDQEFPIEDSYGFNQNLVRELNPTDDLMVQLDVDFENQSALSFAFRRGDAEFVFSVSKTEREFTVTYSGSSKRKPLVLAPKLESDLPAADIEFSSFDRTINLRINGTNVFELRENESADESTLASVFVPDSKSVFRLRGDMGIFRINRIRIWRDLYYLPSPAGFQVPQNLKLKADRDEYILLGDNSPKSLDSRTWKKPGIPGADLIGKLIPALPPSDSRGGDWR